MAASRATIRIDKWLWYARFFKTRGLASKLAAGGHIRVNSQRVAKASFSVGAGDTLTFPQARQIRVIRIVQTGARRGPAPEAATLYNDLTPVQEPATGVPAPRSGRPSRDDRRRAAKLKRFDLE